VDDLDVTEGDEGTEGDGDSAGAAPTPAVATTLPPEAIRNSPEYKELAKQNRKLARQLGDATTAAAAARGDAEAARLAAEAQQQAALEADLRATLGDEGIALWAEIAELSATDQRAAATRLAEALRSRVQSSEDDDAAAAAGVPDAGGSQVPAQTPPPPSRGAEGGAQLNAQPQDTPEAVIAALEKNYLDTVERVQDPLTRNRVTMRDRAAAFINYLGAGYLKAGATPKQPRG
jgi:hypothetical protein